MNKDFTISEMRSENLKDTLDLVLKVFMEYEAPDYSDEGTQLFKNIIEINAVQKAIDEKRFFIWCCHDNERMVGVIAMIPPCHIELLFVDGEYHRRGIARAMITHVIKLYKSNYGYKTMTVNSSPFAVEIYHRLGFSDTDIEQTVYGLRYTPMKRPL